MSLWPTDDFDAEGDHVALGARATMVFVATGTIWKIAHEHISPFVANEAK